MYPKNGLVSCLSFGSVLACSPYCQDGYDFGLKPEERYYCTNGVWKYESGPTSLTKVKDVKKMMSDCSRK